MGLFGQKKVDPVELARSWKNKLRTEERQLDRQLRKIQEEENKIKNSMRDAAKKNQLDAVKILAKELIQSRKAKNRIFKTKAQMNSVALQLQQQASQAKVMGALGKSTEIMTMMNNLCKVPEVAATMRAMAMEMEKAGILEEMVDDAMESLDDDTMEEETEEAVSQILDEVIGGKLAEGKIATSALPAKKAAAMEAEGEDEELSERLKSLKG